MHVLAPAATLAANPLPGAVAVLPLKEAIATKGALPQDAARLALQVGALC